MFNLNDLTELSNNSLIPLDLLASGKQISTTTPSGGDDLAGLISKYNRKSNFTSGKAGNKFIYDYFEMFANYYTYDEGEDHHTIIRKSYLKMKRFLELEINITSRELFFAIFGDTYTGGEMNCMFLDEIEAALERHNRDHGNYSTNSKWANFQTKIFAEYEVKRGNKNHHVPNIGKYVKFLNSLPDDEPVTMYRGFICRKELGKQIRESNNKQDAGYWSQIEGRGTSYSLDKLIAETFAIRRTDVTSILKVFQGMCRLHPFPGNDHLDTVKFYQKLLQSPDGYAEIISEVSRVLGWQVSEEGGLNNNPNDPAFYLDMNKTTPISELVDNIINVENSWIVDAARDIIENEGKFLHILPEEFGDTDSYAGYGVRPIVGTYSVFKKDILTIHDKFGEAEITVLPKNAYLERYDFMTSDEIGKSSVRIMEGLNQ